MKKAFTRIILPLFVLAFLFSSCLGDSSNENTIGSDRDFAYIGNSSGITYAATAAYGVKCTSSGIQDLIPGECYYISYKIIIDNTVGTNGIYKAEEVHVSPEPIVKGEGLRMTGSGMVTNTIIPTSFVVARLPYKDNFLGDRWLFSAKAKLKGDGADRETVLPYFYYDENNQAEAGDMDGTKKIILDVRFVKSNEGSTAEAKDVSFEFVENFTRLREDPKLQDKFVNPNSSDPHTEVPIKFRYYREKAGSTTGETELVIVNSNYNIAYSNKGN